MTSIVVLWLGLWSAPPLALDDARADGLSVVLDAPALAPLAELLDRPALHGVGAVLETLARGWLALPRTPSAQLSGFGIWIDLVSLQIDTGPPPTVAEAAATL